MNSCHSEGPSTQVAGFDLGALGFGKIWWPSALSLLGGCFSCSGSGFGFQLLSSEQNLQVPSRASFSPGLVVA